MIRRLAPAFVLSSIALLAACGTSSDPAAGGTTSTTASGGTSTTQPALAGDITVFAAASLKESFTTIAAAFEKAHPGTKVTFNFGPSSGLATSITGGAPVDVFASASQKNMDQVTTAGLAKDPTPFASNVMAIVTPPTNPGRVDDLKDLTNAGLKVALCQAQVACGTVAAKVFANAKITVKPVTEEVDVKAVLTKVTLGEVDAGLVYVTDARAASGKVATVDIPADVNASTKYPIVALDKAPNAALARAFVDYVLSADGLAVLSEAGFAKP